MQKTVALSKLAAPLLYEAKAVQLAMAAEKYRGNFDLMADAVGLTVQQVQRYYKEYPEFKEIVDTAREAFYNKALNKLEELIEDGDRSALNLYFSRSPWAKANGWADSVQTNQTIKLSDAEKAAAAREILGIDDK